MTASFDVVCVGGAAIGSSVAYALSENPDFDGTVAVIEPDPTYEFSSTGRSHSSIREQFSHPVNIRASQYGMDFIANFDENVQVDGDSPALNFRGTGYLFIAKTDEHLEQLDAGHRLQVEHGAGTRMLTPDELAAEHPYMDVTGIKGARLGSLREGSFDPWALLQGFRRRAEHNGVHYIKDRAVDITVSQGRVSGVTLSSGESIECGHVVNAAGPRARIVAGMVGLDIPVEPRIRSSFAFACRTPIEQNVPLTILPEGCTFRREQQHFMCLTRPVDDVGVDYDDFDVRRDEFEEQIWPVIASYVPVFDRVSIVTSWGGHYAFNTLDQNVIMGPPPNLENFYFANGFSGHGIQHSPAVGRGISELITYGEYRALDMSELGYTRVLENRPIVEKLIIS